MIVKGLVRRTSQHELKNSFISQQREVCCPFIRIKTTCASVEKSRTRLFRGLSVDNMFEKDFDTRGWERWG